MTQHNESLNDIFSDYYSHVSAYRRTTTATTVAHRLAALESVFDPELPAWTFGLRSIVPVIDHYVVERRREGVADSTINAELKVLRAALNHAGIKAEYITLLKESKTLPTVLSKGEVERVLTVAAEPFRTMILLAWRTGLRAGEIRTLYTTDIRPEGVWVHAKPEIDWFPKTHHERLVPLTMDAYTAVHRLPQDSAWLFPSAERRGEVPISAPHVAYGVRKAFKAAGLYVPQRKPGLHMLRRTWATELLAAGVDIETVRQMGGWASLEIVQRYVTTNYERMREAISRLEA